MSLFSAALPLRLALSPLEWLKALLVEARRASHADHFYMCLKGRACRDAARRVFEELYARVNHHETER
jgi:hypothetical protein